MMRTYMYMCFILLVISVRLSGKPSCYIVTQSGEYKTECCPDDEAKANDCIHYTFTIEDAQKKYTVTVISIRLSESKRCRFRTGSGKIKTACCRDYEEKENDCIPCSRGYTSKFEQSCRPCQHNTYGERCKFDCSCSDFEICNHVYGCVDLLSPTSTSVYETSDKTMSTLNLEAISNGENIGTSGQGQLSKELIVCFILSVFVMVFGIRFCLVSFKYIALTKQRKATSSIIQSQTSAIPQNSQNIEMENRLYDIINETDMLDDQQVQQMEMSSAYLDVIDDSSIRDGSENKPFENHDNSCELISSAQTHTQENKGDFLSLRSDDSTSSCDEYHQDSTQDYLNPYQSMIQSEMSPPEVTEYLTLARDNSRIDSSMPYHQKKYSLQHLPKVENNYRTKTYENVLDVAYPSARPI